MAAECAVIEDSSTKGQSSWLVVVNAEEDVCDADGVIPDDVGCAEVSV